MNAAPIKYADLQLGDIVDLGLYEYSTATVIGVNEERKTVTFFRPYTHTGDVAYSDGKGGLKLLEYTGAEKFDVHRDSDRAVTLLRRMDPRPR